MIATRVVVAEAIRRIIVSLDSRASSVSCALGGGTAQPAFTMLPRLAQALRSAGEQPRFDLVLWSLLSVPCTHTPRKLASKHAMRGAAALLRDCDGQTGAVVIGFFIVVAFAFSLTRLLPLLYRAAVSPASRELIAQKAAAQASVYTIGTKFKILLGFYMIATKVPNIYEVQLPESVMVLLAAFETGLSLGISTVHVPLQCIGAHDFAPRLLFYFFAPIFAVLAILSAFALPLLCKHTLCNCLRPKHVETAAVSQAVAMDQKRIPIAAVLSQALLGEIPYITRFLFIIYPVVTTIAFQAFPCHDFGPDGQWLIADVSLRCSSAEHDRVVALAWLVVLVYPVGLLLFAAALLGYLKAEVTGVAPKSTLCKAVSFLYASYKPQCYYWELAEMTRRFFLVGIAVIIRPGSVVQITLGTLFCTVYQLIQMQAAPYTDASNNFVALASTFSMQVKLGAIGVHGTRLRLCPPPSHARAPQPLSRTPRLARVTRLLYRSTCCPTCLTPHPCPSPQPSPTTPPGRCRSSSSAASSSRWASSPS